MEVCVTGIKVDISLASAYRTEIGENMPDKSRNTTDSSGDGSDLCANVSDRQEHNPDSCAHPTDMRANVSDYSAHNTDRQVYDTGNYGNVINTQENSLFLTHNNSQNRKL